MGVSVMNVRSLCLMHSWPHSRACVSLGCQGNGLGRCPVVPAVCLASIWTMEASLWQSQQLGQKGCDSVMSVNILEFE